MDKFVVSARKYRPQNFNTVVGQEHITTTLKNAILHNQLAHAFLFCGPRGVGKTTCARILAKTINCENKTPEGEACNTCNSCISFDAGTSLNIHELDAASNNSVDDIRALVEQVRFPPQAGEYKVYIVDEVHMLSAAAFNAFLKTLEEPPPYAIFILATTEKHKILPTILSRCQIFDFKRITNADTVGHLQEIVGKEEIHAEKAALQLIAQKSEGCMRDSLSILDKIVSFTNGEVTYQNTLGHLNILDEDYYFKLLDALQAQDLASVLLLFDEINRKGFEGDMVLNGFSEFIRNIMVCKDAKAAALLDVVEGMQPRYQKKAQATGLSYLVSGLNILNESEIQFKQARNRRLHVELCLIKLCYLQQALELSAGPDGELIKKKRIDGPVAYRTKTIPSFSIKKQATDAGPTEAKLFVETVPMVPQAAEATSLPVIKAEALAHASTATSVMPTNTGGPRKSLLDSLKEKHQASNGTGDAAESIPLTQEAVALLWAGYAAKCKEKQQHSIANSFETATLRILDAETIEVVSLSILTQKFIEQEKVEVLQMFQAQFRSRKIQFQYRVESNITDHQPIDKKYLSSAERFRLIAKEYPLVVDLKDKLRLELDY
ncbi:MAG: DNA polymerase III subunit gamma/tau [Chitinophagaceae bacterium]